MLLSTIWVMATEKVFRKNNHKRCTNKNWDKDYKLNSKTIFERIVYSVSSAWSRLFYTSVKFAKLAKRVVQPREWKKVFTHVLHNILFLRPYEWAFFFKSIEINYLIFFVIIIIIYSNNAICEMFESHFSGLR